MKFAFFCLKKVYMYFIIIELKYSAGNEFLSKKKCNS